MNTTEMFHFLFYVRFQLFIFWVNYPPLRGVLKSGLNTFILFVSSARLRSHLYTH